MAQTGGARLVREQQLLARPWEGLPPGTAEVLRRHHEELAPRIIDAIREGVPAYARPLTGAFGEGVRTGVQSALDQFVALIDGGDPAVVGLPSPSVYRALGAGEAREGRSLEALLAAYRLGARVAWRHVARVAREEELGEDTMALLAESIFAYIDEMSSASAEGHAREQSAAAGELERRRRLLAGLLMGPVPTDATTLADAARAAHWELPATVAALVWRQEGEDRLAAHLPHGTLTAPLAEDSELQCALVPDPVAPGRLADLGRAVGAQRAALGPAVPSGEAGHSVRRATAALRLPGPAGLVRAEERLADLLLTEDPALAAELARRRLAPLDPLPGAVRARQEATLLAWLDHQGNVPATARALHVHPQTVRYRFNQLREAFGEALADPAARFELHLALRAQRALAGEPCSGS